MVDVHANLPPIETLDPGRQVETAKWIRGILRPVLLRRLAALATEGNDDPSVAIDRMEFALRLRQVEVYLGHLDRAIEVHSPPRANDRRPVVLLDVRCDAQREALARTCLYFAQSTGCIVHGPDSLRYALHLAERLFAPGESLDEVELACWRRVIAGNLQLRVRERERGEQAHFMAGDDAERFSIFGTLRTSRGRRLDFAGEEVGGDPITEEAAINECVRALLEPLRHSRSGGRDEFALRLDPSSPKVGALNGSRTFAVFVLVELLGIAVGLRKPGESSKHLIVKLEGMMAPPALGDLAVRGFTLEYERFFDLAHRPCAQTTSVPFSYRFRPLQSAWRAGRMAITNLTVPELLALRHSGPEA